MSNGQSRKAFRELQVAATSSEQASNQVELRRSARTNLGKNGLVTQLEKLDHDLETGGGSKRKKSTVNMPEGLPDNDMAPPASKRRIVETQVF